MRISDPIAALLGLWSNQICLGSILLRLALSMLFGAIIGCERATKRHAAGLRTFMLVSLASTLAMMLDVALVWPDAALPLLSAAAVIGIAIISSNSILFSSRSQIKGLTTSVGLWACGAVGLALGAGAVHCGADGLSLPADLSVGVPRL